MYNGNNFLPLSNNRVNIKRLLLIPTRERYNDVAQRSYNLNCNNRNIDGLGRLLENNNAMRSNGVSDIEVVSFSPELLNLNPMISGIAKIPHGWQTQRLRFLLETENQVGTMIVSSFIQGFSEYHDPSLTGLIDPNMVFYINSITNVKKYLDPNTNILTYTPYNTYNVISDINGDDSIESIERNPTVVTRPSDVMTDIVINDRYGASKGGMINTVVSDVNRVRSGSFLASRRTNNNPLTYLSKSLSAILASSRDVTGDIGYDQTDTVERAALIAGEPNMDTCALLSAISNITGEITVSSFTLSILSAIDPSLENSGKVKLIDNSFTIPTYQTFLDTNDTESAIQPTDINIKSSLVCSTVPSLMLDNLLTDIGFSVSNSTGEPIVLVTTANSFVEGIDITRYVESFKYRFASTVLPILTNQNLSLLELHVTCDILGDINIGINIDNSGLRVYRFPTFADSLYAPVINNNNGATMFREDFRTMFDVTNSFAKSKTGNNIPLDHNAVYGTFY